jgi:hypothetical protein
MSMFRMNPTLVAAFDKTRDEITALHGPPDVATDCPRLYDNHWLLVASWPIRGANHGFRIKQYDTYAELTTWAHVGDFASATVKLRASGDAGEWLRRCLPPTLLKRTEPVITHLIAGN